MRRLLAILSATALAVALLSAFGSAGGAGAAASSVSASAAAPPKWRTTIFSRVGFPGYPAYVHKHRNGRVYAGTYVNGDSTAASRVREWTAGGQLLRTWKVPGQKRDGSHGIQVANQTRDGKLIVLETSNPRVLTLDPRTGKFRVVAKFPAGAIPNFATWGPKNALYVTDYGQGVLWRVKPRGNKRAAVKRWLVDPALEGIDSFGTTGIVYRKERRELLVNQQTSLANPGDPTRGFLYSIRIGKRGAAKAPRVLWTSRSTDLPDGVSLGRSGHIYMAMVGLTAQLVELNADGVEIDRFPEIPGSGDNGSPIPFDNPSNMTFSGRYVLVANQSALAGNTANQAILKVYIGERGRPTFLPRQAMFSR